MEVMNRLKNAVEKRSCYNRTVREIENMPLAVAQDLGIFHEDARKIARRAVYG